MTAAWRLPEKGSVSMIENTFAPMRDGTRLAVQLWMPSDPGRLPAPVVLEYIPYRKRDRYRALGGYWGRTLAQYGVAYARVDTRGSGDSTGVLVDEYLPIEQADAVEVIAWLAAQPWCNGAVGMRGVSWGGFSALQAAALRPPALKAIMPMCASDNRYARDAHYIGGAFALTGLKWAASMKLVMAAPPDPLITGEGWLEAWRERLAATPPIAARWLSHQTHDAYWRQGSVGVDYGAIQCPVYVVGGLVDSYGAAIPRLLAGLTTPRKAILGPWRHGYPSPAAPGPALDWAWEEVRWWRRWLMNEETGVMEGPVLRVYMPTATAAEVSPGPIPGRWVGEGAWPPPNVDTTALFLSAGRLTPSPGPPSTIPVHGGRAVGLGKVEWVPFAPSELPPDQAPDDARSTVFETAVLSEDLEILGSPVLHVRVAANRADARLAVRLCEVTPEGKSWLVTYGVLNLTRRDGHQIPAPLEPGRFYDVALPLDFTAHRFRAGRRLRAALSEGLWPLVWPSPEVVNLEIDTAASRLELPVRRPPAAEAPMPIAMTDPMPSHPAAWPNLNVTEMAGKVEVIETWPVSQSEVREIGESMSGAGPNVELFMRPADPTSCVWKAAQWAAYRRPGWDVVIRSEVAISADRAEFHVEERTLATLNGEAVADVEHAHTIPRVLM